MDFKELKLNDRSGFTINLLSNLNYYGNLNPKIHGKSVKKIVSSVKYEELKDVSYNPSTKELRCTVQIKKQSGYSGDNCQSGSYEYVRFYIDYENNGNWEDLGVTSFKIHNIEKQKGLCYGLKLDLKPSMTKACDAKYPVLPNVRAILSWNVEPMPDNPNYKPVWGNAIESRILIEPDLKIFQQHIHMPGKYKVASFTKNPLVKLNTLKKIYKNKVDDARLVSMALKDIHTGFGLKDLIKSKNKFNVAKINFSKALNILSNPKFNTNYEELKSIALNRKLSELHADIHLKKTSGYSGNLCSTGSKEYVSFYMDFGSGWEFMGTSSVAVYDIHQMPKEGLWYNVSLPVDLTAKQKEYCQEGIAKIKGILSWNVVPVPNNPNYVATWGDWEICNAEIKPLPKGITHGTTNQPWIESLGGVDNDIIDPITGLAKGPSEMANSIIADYSPFDGNIYITGKIINQSANPSYKVMIKEPGGSFLPFKKKFSVYVTTYNTILGTQTQATVIQSPTGDYYDYLPKTTGGIQKSVNANMLAKFKPTEEGIHELYIESQTGELSETVRFMVDKDIPKVEIDITSGNCGKFDIGTLIKGTFKVFNDTHLDYVRLRLAPINPTGIVQLVNIDSISAGDTATSSGDLKISIDDKDSDLDFINGQWEINTANLPACGYTIHIRAEDRTIINSSHVGKYSPNVSKGFCLK
jgi:hypothetical protein